MSAPELAAPGTSAASATQVRRAAHLLTVVFLALPFCLFYWQLPFVSSQTIGCDYTIFPGRQQQELLFSLRLGSFPLFVPGFAGGHTASALTLGQIFHPQTYLAAVSPGYWHGHALEWNTFWRLVSLGLTHLVLFRLLRRFGLRTFFAAVFGGIAVYNLRTLDWFRFGSSLEAYTAFLIASAAVFWYRLEPARWLPRVGLVAATYCLLISGHPQVMYYGMLGVGVSVLVAPWYVGALGLAEHPTWRDAGRFWLRCACLLLAGILLGSAYVAPFLFDFLADNTQRAARGYGWANSLPDSLAGTLHNFFLPLRSSVAGSFGGTSLFLVAALTPVLAAFRVRLPGVVWFLWGLCVLAFLHMQGERTPLHFLLWKYLPLASAFRVAGRISMLLPLWFVLLLAWQVRRPPLSFRTRELSPLVPCVAIAAVLTAGYLLLPAAWIGKRALWTPFGIPEWPHVWTWALGLVSLLGLLWTCRAFSRGTRAVVPAAVFVLPSLGLMGLCLRHGTWIEERVPCPTYDELVAEKRASVDFTGDPGNGLYPGPLVRHLRDTPAEPWLARLYERHVPVRDTEEAYERLVDNRDPWTVFVEGDPEAADMRADAEGARSAGAADVRTLAIGGSTITLEYASFNRLTFRVDARRSAFLGLGYPWSRHWEATIDGAPVTVRRANGGYHALRVPAGTSTLDLRYRSVAAVTGIAVSLGTLSLLLVLLSLGTVHGRMRGAALALSLAAGPGVFLLWYRSLYDGANLETAYTWEAPATVSARENLAFGRRAWLSSIRQPQYHHLLGGQSAVDAKKDPGSGALTRTEERARWVLDLGQESTVREIVVHEGDESLGRRSKLFTLDPVNERPLAILTSLDNESWDTARIVRRPPSGLPLRLRFDPPLRARLLCIVGQDTRLALSEVEVYER